MDQVEVIDECCDVCSQTRSLATMDCSRDMTAIVHAVKEIPNKGEKKVYTSLSILGWYVIASHPVFCSLQSGYVVIQVGGTYQPVMRHLLAVELIYT